MKHHRYEIEVIWTGNLGEGTTAYTAYQREHEIRVTGKPSLPGSSDPNFRGDPTRYNPEELLVASLSACHMLWYLHLCSVNGVVVTNYEDTAHGLMSENSDGSGVFQEVTAPPTCRNHCRLRPGKSDVATRQGTPHVLHSELGQFPGQERSRNLGGGEGCLTTFGLLLAAREATSFTRFALKISA